MINNTNKFIIINDNLISISDIVLIKPALYHNGYSASFSIIFNNNNIELNQYYYYNEFSNNYDNSPTVTKNIIKNSILDFLNDEILKFKFLLINNDINKNLNYLQTSDLKEKYEKCEIYENMINDVNNL
jgi:hypothetical protein